MSFKRSTINEQFHCTWSSSLQAAIVTTHYHQLHHKCSQQVLQTETRCTIIEFLFGWVALPIGNQSPAPCGDGFPTLTNHFPFFFQRKWISTSVPLSFIQNVVNKHLQSQVYSFAIICSHVQEAKQRNKWTHNLIDNHSNVRHAFRRI